MRRISDCGLRIADLSLTRVSFGSSGRVFDRKFAIRNPKFFPGRGARVVELAALEML
jgi:hypothetical protein